MELGVDLELDNVFCFSLSFTLHKCLAKENSRAAQTDSREYNFFFSPNDTIPQQDGMKTRYHGNEQ